MAPKSGTPAKPSQATDKRRLALGLLLLLVAVGVVVYLTRDRFETHNPEIGKHTDVVIEGTVTCNGQIMPGGYVVAWQNGPPVAFCDVREDGTFRMVNAPLGKCLITYSAIPPKLIAPRHNLREVTPDQSDPSKRPGPKDKPPGNGKNKEKGGGKKEKDAPSKEGKDPMSKGAEPLPFDPLAPPPVGNVAPISIQHLTPEQRKFVESASAKYSDPSKGPLQFETKKGVNSLNLTLTTP